jgi:hypothetical protein
MITSINEFRELNENSSDDINVGDTVTYIGDHGKDVYITGMGGDMYKVNLTLGADYKVIDLYGSNVIVIDDSGNRVNGHGISASRFKKTSARKIDESGTSSYGVNREDLTKIRNLIDSAQSSLNLARSWDKFDHKLNEEMTAICDRLYEIRKELGAELGKHFDSKITDADKQNTVNEGVRVSDVDVISKCDSAIIKLNELSTVCYNAIQPPNDKKNGTLIPWPKTREVVESAVEYIDKMRSKFMYYEK